MSETQETDLARKLAKTKIEAAVKKLGDSITKNKTKRVITSAYNSVKENMEKFEELHTKYALLTKADLDDPAMKSLLDAVLALMDNADTQYENYMDVLEQKEQTSAANKKELQKKAEGVKRKTFLRKQMTVEWDNLEKQLKSKTNAIDNDEELDAVALSEDMTYLDGKFKEVWASLDEFSLLAADGESAEVLDEKIRTETLFRDYIKKIKTFLNTNGSQPPPVSSRSSSPTRDAGFRHRRIEFPKFNGSLRQFATFTRDFNNVVIKPNIYDNEQLSHILRNECLTGEAKTLVHNIDDYDAIWKKLREKYDDKSEVVDQISRQLQALKKVQDEDYEGFVKLVDLVEKADLDLTAMKDTKILSNPMTVRLILGKCPTRVREDVMRELNGKADDEEFEIMLKYLVNRRKDATRLARLEKSDDKPNKPVQNKQKGNVNAADGRKPDPGGGGGGRGWTCEVAGCKYKQKHFLSECRAFKKLAVNDKGKHILDKKLCVLCFNGGHAASACPRKPTWKPCDVGGCGGWHSRLLHGAVVPGLVLVSVSDHTSQYQTLLLVQRIPTPAGVNCLTFWDSGSTTSLVSLDFATAAGLEGVDCCFELTGVAGMVESFTTKLFIVPLVDRQGSVQEIHAFGIERITSDIKSVNLEKAADIFNITSEQLDRPHGQVQLLVGIGHADLMPTKYSTDGKLVLYTSEFGTGYVLGGAHRSIQQSGVMDGGAHSVSHLEVRHVKPLDFLTVEGFGIDIPKRCKNCLGCKECGFKARQLSWNEAKELGHIERGLSLDPINKVWTAEYPFHTDPSILKDNYRQAYACLMSLEKRLEKDGQLEAFNKQFEDAVERGVFEVVQKEAKEEYAGPVNYITITEAYKDGESTTPIRLCMNSSMKYQGLSLNDLLMKGPSALNDIFSVLLNFRSYPVAFVKDLSKFYQSVLASERDQHLRRVLWRGGDLSSEPKIYKTVTVNFGDKPAGCVALTAVRETADLYRHIDPDAAEKLKDDSYCDDTASGAGSREQAIITSENMDKIVMQGGFKFKTTVMSGDDCGLRKVLGTYWEPKNDTLAIDVRVNVSGKRKGVRLQPDISFEDLRENFPEVLTKRIIWRVVLGQFDLLGLACVFFIKLKLLMRDLSGAEGRKLGWDDAVAPIVREKFITVIDQMAQVKDLAFPRCVVPEGRNLDKLPDLLCFGDGSKQAFCALAYLRWQMEDGTYKCLFVSGKTRVAPLRKISVPRIELMGAVANVRLAENIQNSLKIQIGRRFFFTDSSAVFGMIHGECSSFQEFVGTRTGEIKSKSDPGPEWFWLATNENLADLGTREDVVPADLHPTSAYLIGKPWMCEDFNKWPVNQHPGAVPEEELTPSARSVMVVKVAEKTDLFNVQKYRSFAKLVRVSALVFKAVELFKEKKLKQKILVDKKKAFDQVPVFQLVTAEDLSQAENYWFHFTQQNKIMPDFEKGKLSTLSARLCTVQVFGEWLDIVVTAGRLGGAMVIGYDKEELPILEATDPIAKLIMLDAHNQEHCGVDRSLWRSRNTAWITQGRRIAKVVNNNCFKCKIKNKLLAKQVMAPIPESRLPPAQVFSSTAIDLFGPLEIRDSVKKRVTMKGWGVIFCCTVTSAIHLEIAENYSCDTFLCSVRRFCNFRGTPKRIQSDPGSQLMAAAAEIGKWDYSKITEWSVGAKTTWHFVPADSQHFNGCAEAMIKVTKRQLSDSLKSKRLTKGELDTLLSDVSFIINSRPLMKRAGEDPLAGCPITPLHLIGGRCTQNVPTINLDEAPRLTKRLRFIEETTQEFWKKWFTQVFHNLVPSYKWKTKYRDVKQGDIVLLKESNILKREYKLARVKETKVGDDGHVRRITLEYKNLSSTGTNQDVASKDLKSTPFSTTERSIHNVVVIVPVDWKPDEIEAVVTAEQSLECAF